MTVLVWLVLIIGIGDLVIGVIGGSIAYVVWGLLFAAAAGWALLRGR